MRKRYVWCCCYFHECRTFYSCCISKHTTVRYWTLSFYTKVIIHRKILNKHEKLCLATNTASSINYNGSLTHWGRVTHICIGNLTIIGPDNILSPGQCQAIIWTNAGILLFGPWGTNFSEILINIQTFSFEKMHLKMLSGKWRPICLGLNVLRIINPVHTNWCCRLILYWKIK